MSVNNSIVYKKNCLPSQTLEQKDYYSTGKIVIRAGGYKGDAIKDTQATHYQKNSGFVRRDAHVSGLMYLAPKKVPSGGITAVCLRADRGTFQILSTMNF